MNLAGTKAFFVELEVSGWQLLDCTSDEFAPDWVTSCSVNEPLANGVLIAGVGPPTTGIFEIARVFLSNAGSNQCIRGRVEYITNLIHATSTIQTAQWGCVSLETASIPSYPLVDLATVSHMPRVNMSSSTGCRAGILQLTRKQRSITSMTFSTDMELSLMVRLVDRMGTPDETGGRVFAYLTPAIEYIGGEWIPCQHYQDGWYGIQYKGGVEPAETLVSFMIRTVDALGTTYPADPDRFMSLGTIPVAYMPLQPSITDQGFNLTIGSPYQACPWDAVWPSTIDLSFTVTFPTPTDQPSDLTRAIACNLSVPPTWVYVSRSTLTQYIIKVSVESFLRSYDIYQLALDPNLINYWFHKTPLGITRRSRAYAQNPQENTRTCPPFTYYSTVYSRFLPLPPHSHTTARCYGLICDEGFTEIYSTQTSQPHCEPDYASDDVYWTVAVLLLVLLGGSGLLICLMRAVCARMRARQAMPENPPAEEEKDIMLPVSTDEHGNLVMEETLSSSGSSPVDSGESSQEDEFFQE